MNESQSPKSRLPRPGTILLVGFVMLLIGGALMVWWPYYHEQRVIAEIERLGGETRTTVVRPFWIPEAVDDEYLKVFQRVYVVNLNDTQVTDAGLEHLRGLTNLVWLWLNNTPVTDAGLEHLRGLTNLQWLRLDNTPVTDAGVKKLQKLRPACQIHWTRRYPGNVRH